MYSLLLNPKLWAALIVTLAVAAAGMFTYKKGEEHVQVTFDAYKNQQVLDLLAAEKAARAKEQSLQTANEKVTARYDDLKTTTTAAIRSLDNDRLRLQSALAAYEAARHPEAGVPADASPEVRVLSGCLERYETVAGDADTLSDQVKALQDYVRTVVQ